MNQFRVFALSWLAILALPTANLNADPKPEYGKIEIVRDTWGIPHVFSHTDPGAMYGLGYATADQRGFQMTYSLRIIQGRLAEMVGNRPRTGRQETALDHDRKMRTFGWARAAVRTAANLDSDTLVLLRSYCEGVNDSFAAQQTAGTLHPLFKQLDVKPEPWTPADCLLSWWHLAQFFASDGTRDLIAWRNRANPLPRQPEPPTPGALWKDDTAAVVQRQDVSDDWVRHVEAFGVSIGLPKTGAGVGDEAPKFSHAWVVGGNKSSTRSAVLVSDPQTPVRNPSLWMEFHVRGKTFDARGVGVPGSPGLLIGFNRNVAWGLTALGADQADLFRLETNPEHPDQYRWNGQWRQMEVRPEHIAVKCGQEVVITVRETALGPVVSAFAFRLSEEPEVALKRVPMCETNRDTIQGLLAIMRARNASELTKALRLWRFPTANCVYGDTEGHIGYLVLGAIPVRSRFAPDPDGNAAAPGTSDTHDWQGFVPPDLLPQVSNPKHGFLLSANHRPAASFYTIPLGISTGSIGDTIRSWRLRERLSLKDKFTPSEVLDIHYDTINPARREIVRLGLHLRDTGQGGLSDSALKALAILETWLKASASSDLKTPGAELATQISTFFRFVTTPLAAKYGGGESGLARFLKDAAARIDANPKAAFGDDERRFIDNVLASAWQEGSGRSRSAARSRDAGNPAQGRTLAWFDSLDGFGSLDVSGDLPSPALACLDDQTILSQAAQSYTQWVPLHDVDSAKTICPIGHSDRPDSRYRTSTMKLWGDAKLHPAPLSRDSVEKLAAERLTLSASSR
jgi:penicillin amidase